jgi:DNA-binding response OmpR family regulator
VNVNTAPPVVLIADDEPTMLELVARHLRSLDKPKMEVIEASDGDEAWRLARERLPDLVVLDVMMPGMSGWEVCRKIRQDAAFAHTGVLMLTGIGESLNEATSPLFGADDYIDKPFDFEDLDRKILGVLRRRAPQRDAVPRATTDLHPSDEANGSPNGSRPTPRAGRPPKRTKRARPTSRAPARRTKSNEKTHAKSQKGLKKMAAKKAAKKTAKKTAKKAAKKTAKKGSKKK